eukprot:6186955-Pleurochrysis_carterae.AAC.1
MKCFGGLLGPPSAEGLHVIGFDDGNLQTFPEAELKQMKHAWPLLAIGREEPGMAESKSGVPKAAGFTGGGRSLKTVLVPL